MLLSKSEAIALGKSKYFTGKPCKRGHLSDRYTSNSDCVSCSTDRAMGVHSGLSSEQIYKKQRERRENNLGRYLESEKRYREANAEKFRNISRAYYQANKEKCSLKGKKWREKNKEELRSCWREASRRRRLSPEGKLISGLRSRISAMVSCSTKSRHSKEYLGCSVEDFRKHLESLFRAGMNWDNYGIHGWHIDHIRPLASFDLSSEEGIRDAFHYSNTQPLWAAENLAKGATWQA